MLKALIIDDEQHAREKLALLLERYFGGSITLIGQAQNADEGERNLQELRPDLVFLDVEMPGRSGFDLLRSVGKPSFEVVFTTAHDHYAIKAIKFSAVDYLLKPIDVDQLREAIARVTEKRGLEGSAARLAQLMESTAQGGSMNSLSVPCSTGFVRVKLDRIVWCEAQRYFTIFHLVNKEELVATRSIGEFEDMLEGSGFIRSHNSYLINIEHVERYIKGAGGQVVMSDGKTLDVSRRKKDEVMARLGG